MSAPETPSAAPQGAPGLTDDMIDDAMRAFVQDCCMNDSWRGHLCSYHSGMEDGMDVAQALLAEQAQRLLTESEQ